MALPNVIAEQLAQYHDLSQSVERSQYSEDKQTWAEGSGNAGQEITLADQALDLAMKSAAGGLVFFMGPSAIRGAGELSRSTKFQSWQLSGSFSHVNKVSDVFNLKTGKEAMKTLRAVTFRASQELMNITSSDDPQSFWYAGIKKVEQSGLDLPIFDNVVKLFAKATYMSDVLSYTTKRKGKTVLNVSMNALGATNRSRTLDLYSKQLRMNRKKLELLDYLIFEDGDVFAGRLNMYGEVVAAAGPKQRLNKKAARLVDKGLFTEALLGVVEPSLGLKNKKTGATFAEGIGGKEGYVLLAENNMDPELTRMIGRMQNLTRIKFLPGKNGAGTSLADLGLFKGTNLRRYATTALLTEAYGSMALQRTSRLFSELYNQVGDFFEYISPAPKQKIYNFLSKNNLAPRIDHGHGAAMLVRYAGMAAKVAFTLATVNQLGWNMMNGDPVTAGVSGGLQTVGLTVLGAYLGKKVPEVLSDDLGFAPVFKKMAMQITDNSQRRTLVGAGMGAALGVLGMAGVGPFAAGPIPGVANLVARGNEIRSYVGEVLPVNAWRRNVEEMMPGSTGVISSLGVGFLAGASYVAATRGIRISDNLKIGGLSKDVIVEQEERAKFLRAKFRDRENITLADMGNEVREQAGRVLRATKAHEDAYPKLSDKEKIRARRTLDSTIRKIRGDTGGLSTRQTEIVEQNMNSYISSLEREGEYGLLNNPIGKVADVSNFDEIAEHVTDHTYAEAKSKIFASEKNALGRLREAIRVAPRTRSILYASTVAAAAWFVGTGSMGTLERPSELRELNQGKRLEAVRRGQKWEMGQTGYEGTDILYYRPSLTARLSSGAAQAGASGGHGPLMEMALKNFTYKLERENYWTRPAPITGAAFDQVPFIYPLIQPIADLIKKPRLMHVGEWARSDSEGNVKFVERSTGLDEIPDLSIGGLGMPAPYSPYSPSRVLGDFWEQTTSLGGLVGFYAKTAKNYLTGTPGIADQRQELESFSRNMDMASRFYDLQGGGSFLGVPFVSEPIRRFLHKDDLKQYNPIKNAMPSWMPDSFQYGNQYTNTRYGEGEYRMPGKGYVALHTELKGVNPEDYPLLHKMNILGDVAPQSPQYKGYRRQAELMRSSGEMTTEEEKFFYRHKQNVARKATDKGTDAYQFKPSTYDTISGDVTSVDASTMSFTVSGYGGRFGVAGISNDVDALISDYNLSIKQAAKLKTRNEKAFSSKIQVGQGVTVDVAASIGQAVDERGVVMGAVRNNGFNVNKDIREEGRFAKDDSPIADYAMTNPIGKMFGRAWEATTHIANRVAQPIEHIGMFGMSPVNKLLPFRDALEEYESRELYGTEMKGWDSPVAGWIAPAIKSALHNWLGFDFESPGLREKRDTEEYFDKLKYVKYSGLSQAAGMQGNEQLANQYQNIAQDTYVGGTGYVSEERLGNVLGGRESMFAAGFAREMNPGRQQDIIDALPDYKSRLMEGFYMNQDLEAINRAAGSAPMSTYGMDYAADLIVKKQKEGFDVSDPQMVDSAKLQEVSQFFNHRSMPAVDWIGFNPAVDLEDVKLKYIESEGMNYHDFGIYPSRASYMPRKPYIDEKAMQDLNNLSARNGLNGMANAAKIYSSYGVNSYNIQGPNRNQDFVSLTFNEYNTLNPFM
jgi:hypothetical protein